MLHFSDTREAASLGLTLNLCHRRLSIGVSKCRRAKRFPQWTRIIHCLIKMVKSKRPLSVTVVCYTLSLKQRNCYGGEPLLPGCAGSPSGLALCCAFV